VVRALWTPRFLDVGCVSTGTTTYAAGDVRVEGMGAFAVAGVQRVAVCGGVAITGVVLQLLFCPRDPVLEGGRALGGWTGLLHSRTRRWGAVDAPHLAGYARGGLYMRKTCVWYYERGWWWCRGCT
jgi:hypothetical protein